VSDEVPNCRGGTDMEHSVRKCGLTVTLAGLASSGNPNDSAFQGVSNEQAPVVEQTPHLQISLNFDYNTP
jgi:hypothetical protein